MRARGGRIVVIDPRRSETAEVADEHLFIRPGADVFLLAAMVHTLFDEGLVRLGRLAEHVNGVDEMRAAVATFTPEQLCQLMAVACEPPGDSGRPISQWTPRELADEATKRGIVDRISARTVGRFLVSGGGRGQATPQPVLAHAP